MSSASDISRSINILSKLYNVSPEELKRSLDNLFKNNIQENKPKIDYANIILPFCNVINKDCCKAVVYNHGLYTQCTKKTSNEVCCSCTKLKYGRIEERIKSKPNEFVTPQGRKEVPYQKFMTKMNYSIDDVTQALKLANLSYELINSKKDIEVKKRGRPKKVQKEESDNEEKEEIEVSKFEFNGRLYFKTTENILLNIDTYEVVGVFKNDSIELIK